jgi:hypothetical protein
MRIKETLNYPLIKYALEKRLKSSNGIINNKDIQEEIYKIEDLSNSKAFIMDKLKEFKHLKGNLNINDIYGFLISYFDDKASITMRPKNYISKNYIITIYPENSSESKEFKMGKIIFLFLDLLFNNESYVSDDDIDKLEKKINTIKDIKKMYRKEKEKKILEENKNNNN